MPVTTNRRHCRHRWLLVGLLGCCAAGCSSSGRKTASYADEESGLKSLFRSKVSQASFEEEAETIPAKPKDEAMLHLTFAEWMEDAGDATRAEQHYREVVKAKPKNVAAILGLVRMDILAGRMAEAEEGLHRAQRLAADSADVAASFGQFYAVKEDYEKSIESYTKAVQAEPGNSEYRYQLALSMVRGGRIEAAIPHFASTVGDAAGHYNIALILKDQGDLAGAERHLKIALNKQPKMQEARHWLAEVRRAQGVSGEPAPSERGSGGGEERRGEVQTASAQLIAPRKAPAEPIPTDAPRHFPLSNRHAEQLQNQK